MVFRGKLKPTLMTLAFFSQLISLPALLGMTVTLMGLMGI